MARRKMMPDSVRTKHSLARRLTTLRAERFGERGGPELARRLGIPVRTWYNYEAGVTVPAEVVLKIIELTSVEPMWLLHGKGAKFRPTVDESTDLPSCATRSAGALIRNALRILEADARSKHGPLADAAEESDAPTSESDDAATLVSAGDADKAPLVPASGSRYVAARDEWLEAERESRCLRNTGQAMVPIIADGAYVAFARTNESPEAVDGKLVVAWVEGQPLVRWFQFCGRYGVLRAENPQAEPAQVLIDLDAAAEHHPIRRVLWINTPH